MKKEYCYDKSGKAWPVGPSFIDGPMGGHVLSCPICRACKNQYLDDEKTLKCKAKGSIPHELNHGEVFACVGFDPDKNSIRYELVMSLIAQNK